MKVHDNLEYDVKILDREEIKVTFQFFYLHAVTNDIFFALGRIAQERKNFFVKDDNKEANEILIVIQFPAVSQISEEG